MMGKSEYGGRRSERDLDSYNDRQLSGCVDSDRVDRAGDGSLRRHGWRRDDPDEQKRKMFCGGLSLETTKDAVDRYFTRFGPIQEVIMVPDSRTGRPRGFCFIIFKDESSLDLVLGERTHNIDGRSVECTRAVGREEVRNNPGSIRKTKRVYLARTKDLSEDEIREYFEEYITKDLGQVEIVELLRNKETGGHRGFGFINFSTFEAADKVCGQKDHKIGAQNVVAIKAEPKPDRPPERFDSGSGYGRVNAGSNLSRSSLAPYDGASGHRNYRTIMTPNDRMVAPALQASLAGRSQTAMGSGKTAADLRRLEEEIMLREEQLKLKEMKLRLQTARLSGADNDDSLERAASYTELATVTHGHTYRPAPVMHVSGDAFEERASTAGPIRMRDRYSANDHAPSRGYDTEYGGPSGVKYYSTSSSNAGGSRRYY